MKRFYTAESVTEGHPDKLRDLIADSNLADHTSCACAGIYGLFYGQRYRSFPSCLFFFPNQ